MNFLQRFAAMTMNTLKVDLDLVQNAAEVCFDNTLAPSGERKHSRTI